MDEELQSFLSRIKGAAAYDVGVGVVVREFVQRMQFVETLNELLPWDPKQCAVSPGQRILALVIAYIEDRKALYRIEEAYAHRDVELLLGQGVAAEQLNDKALARALDKLWSADAKRVYSTLCLRAVEAYEVTIDRLHSDT
ncbi:transposase IS4 family protein, partial [mine drainage metagenome]